MILVLLGYMGSGKSLVGRKLAEDKKFEYLDLDNYVEIQEKKTISQIFNDKGEIYFRKKESEYLKEVLESKIDVVISLGGGTPCFAGNMDLLKTYSDLKSIYLNTSLDVLTERLFVEKDKRPLIAHIKEEEDLKDFIRKHLFERSYYYNQADVRVTTDNKGASEISVEICENLF
ncbi:shikimate kinase [Aquimarina sp. D1M17]|uniref:shikimate kinase n=1 Tax=Aquimarina acroporae TaxID=2937283 RepID=UPI0020BDE50F|nr:shikimate kinase [Aquimarina acroporae]MCK8522754.1 shikimate kinase [Aquimarina acroporae]